MTLSWWSTTSIEDVARSAPGGVRWFQLHIDSSRETTVDLIRRAEKMGYEAIVLTVDMPMMGQRYDHIRNRFVLPRSLKFENFSKETASKFSETQSQGNPRMARRLQTMIDPTLNWDSVPWLISVTRLPIVLKGILTGKDAREAVERGVSGIWVSNHGARQLDGVPATVGKIHIVQYIFISVKYLVDLD